MNLAYQNGKVITMIVSMIIGWDGTGWVGAAWIFEGIQESDLLFVTDSEWRYLFPQSQTIRGQPTATSISFTDYDLIYTLSTLTRRRGRVSSRIFLESRRRISMKKDNSGVCTIPKTPRLIFTLDPNFLSTALILWENLEHQDHHITLVSFPLGYGNMLICVIGGIFRISFSVAT